MEKWVFQKQPSRTVLRKRCSENMQQIYRTAPISKCDFNKVAKQVIVSAHATVETIKRHKIGLGYTVLEVAVCFGGFEWNETSNNPEKNSNTRYRSEPQYIL